MNNIALEHLLDLGSWLFGTLGVLLCLPCFLCAVLLLRKYRSSSNLKKIWKNIFALTILFFPFVCLLGILIGRYYFIHGAIFSGLFLVYFPIIHIFLIGSLYFIYYYFISSRHLSKRYYASPLKFRLPQRKKRKIKIIF